MKREESSIHNLLEYLYRYKLWANSELLAKMQLMSVVRNENDLHAAVRILNHTYVVDRIFACNLTSKPHPYSATNTEEVPALSDLTESIRDSDSWYLKYVASLTSSSLAEQVDFNFTDGDSGLMTRAEILLHLINHGSYHRGAAGRMLYQLRIEPPRDTLTSFLHQLEPHRRLSKPKTL